MSFCPSKISVVQKKLRRIFELTDFKVVLLGIFRSKYPKNCAPKFSFFWGLDSTEAIFSEVGKSRKLRLLFQAQNWRHSRREVSPEFFFVLPRFLSFLRENHISSFSLSSVFLPWPEIHFDFWNLNTIFFSRSYPPGSLRAARILPPPISPPFPPFPQTQASPL